MALSLKAYGKMAVFFPIKVIRCPVGFMFEAINVSQKLSPSPAVRDVPPTIYRPNPKKPDQPSPIAARAPAAYLTAYVTVFFSIILRVVQSPVAFGAFKFIIFLG